jgi:hypothetical protein
MRVAFDIFHPFHAQPEAIDWGTLKNGEEKEVKIEENVHGIAGVYGVSMGFAESNSKEKCSYSEAKHCCCYYVQDFSKVPCLVILANYK